MAGIDFAAMANKAAEAQDMTVESTGGNFERVLPDAGKGLCRLREYIELGMQKTATEAYPDKQPKLKARFVFELVTPKHVRTIEPEGKDAFKLAHVIRIDVPIGNNSKSNYMKLFKQLNYKQDVKHPAQLLGRGFLCTIIHAFAKGESATNGDKPSYANLHTGGSEGHYTFEAPRIEDPVEGTVKDLVVGQLLDGTASMKLFLFDQPNMDCWKSLYIDGTYSKKVKGEEVTCSKNFIQNTILEALNFEGSPLDVMLQTGDASALDNLPTDEPLTKDEIDPLEGFTTGVVDPLGDIA